MTLVNLAAVWAESVICIRDGLAMERDFDAFATPIKDSMPRSSSTNGPLCV